MRRRKTAVDLDRRERLRAGLRAQANMTRDAADVMARGLNGCDDPMHPFMVANCCGRDWRDFAERYCWPIIDEPDDDPFGYDPGTQAAMRVFRLANPHYIATCLWMANQTVARLEARIAELEAR